MIVSSYQIHNVLNTYSKQLSQGRSPQKQEGEKKKQLSDQIQLSTKGKRRATIEKVSSDILSKIADFGANGQHKNSAQSLSGGHAKKTLESDDKKESAFVFNSIDNLNKKTKTALSVRDTDFLINKVEQLAKDTVEEDAAN
ncbi:MAG: hypothetical protein PVH74_01120 [Desulfobacterales bacterium]|jgi:hypothetical protein|nr:hypothetical protein [Deltaproteobacteria bacterium]